MSLLEFSPVMASLVLGIGWKHLLQGVAAIIRYRESDSMKRFVRWRTSWGTRLEPTRRKGRRR